ncbi:hypothetical protein TNIN_260431 [Trichonephila inaurata madagascariensis]|uniref:Uncharacterized protein n=1 Tax=Trichonephila inaurata madagascariensis TaxID=2747483 RepID=A0A8X6M967_9ARAC|nr:hypothetical protein TNIN_260431 [Trichonephila inaurata madagascariensis]
MSHHITPLNWLISGLGDFPIVPGRIDSPVQYGLLPVLFPYCVACRDELYSSCSLLFLLLRLSSSMDLSFKLPLTSLSHTLCCAGGVDLTSWTALAFH